MGSSLEEAELRDVRAGLQHDEDGRLQNCLQLFALQRLSH